MRSLALNCLLYLYLVPNLAGGFVAPSTKFPSNILPPPAPRQRQPALQDQDRAARFSVPCPSQSRVTQSYVLSHSALPAQRHQGNSNDVTSNSSQVPRRRSWRKRLRRWAVSFAIATSFLRASPPPAQAKFSYELRETPTSSLRPGMTREQADMVEEGQLDGRSIEAKTKISESSESPTSTINKKSTLYADEEDEDDDFDDFLEEEGVGAATQVDQVTAQNKLSRSNFAAYHQGKSKALTFKVGVAFFVPTYGALIVREYVRRRREEVYVKKGLEVLEAQKAEYFNVTETSADSDVEDALKNLKKNETDTEDDDEDKGDEDDDDDEDDEDTTPRGRRRGPRRPPGGGDGGDNSGGSGDGSGRPSDEDLDKLNQMFKRS